MRDLAGHFTGGRALQAEETSAKALRSANWTYLTETGKPGGR